MSGLHLNISNEFYFWTILLCYSADFTQNSNLNASRFSEVIYTEGFSIKLWQFIIMGHLFLISGNLTENSGRPFYSC
jgi:hypothetical protein